MYVGVYSIKLVIDIKTCLSIFVIKLSHCSFFLATLLEGSWREKNRSSKNEKWIKRTCVYFFKIQIQIQMDRVSRAWRPWRPWRPWGTSKLVHDCCCSGHRHQKLHLRFRTGNCRTDNCGHSHQPWLAFHSPTFSAPRQCLGSGHFSHFFNVWVNSG